MKLLFYAPQMAAYGGMERHICLLAQLCAGTGSQITLVTTSNSLNETWRREMRGTNVRLKELPIERGQAGSLTKSLWLFQTVIRLKSLHWDVIYSNGQSGLAQLSWMARGTNTRIIHHHHTAADEKEQTTWSSSFRSVLKSAPELVGCSQSTCERLRNALRRDGTTFLPYLTDDLGGLSEEISERTYSANDTLNFGFVGRLTLSKGIDTICALSEMPELGHIRWHIYGEGEEYPSSWFDRFPRVLWHGRYKTKEQYSKILESLDALVLLSRHNEGMPLSLIEAMSAGMPWIATDQGGTRELALREENCVLIPAGATLEEISSQVALFAKKIQHGHTSRKTQRSSYDTAFSPRTAGALWLRYFGVTNATSKASLIGSGVGSLHR